MADKSKNLNTELTELLQPLVAAAGLYLEDIVLKRAGKYTTLQVIVDLESGTGGVDSMQLDELTRSISAQLDKNDPISGPYTLEVSTPGVERLLTQQRHYLRASGHLIAFVLQDGEQFTARLQKVAESSLVVVPEIKEKHRIRSGEPREISLSEVKKARVVVELRQLD